MNLAYRNVQTVEEALLALQKNADPAPGPAKARWTGARALDR